jgi:hypothetical protein
MPAAMVEAAPYVARVRWRAVGDAAVTGYRVRVRPLAGGAVVSRDARIPVPAADGTLSFVVGPLDVRTDYAFTVTAYSGAGAESAPSNERWSGYAQVASLVDSDGDGLRDAAEDRNVNRRVDAGETDPLAADTDRDTVGDAADRCPDTPAGTAVNAAGCPSSPTTTSSSTPTSSSHPSTSASSTSTTTTSTTLPAAGTNLILNGGFEEGRTAWRGWSHDEMVPRDVGVAGTRALRFLDGASFTRSVNQTVAVSERTAYAISAWVRTSGLDDGQYAHMIAEWQDASAEIVRSEVVSPTDAPDWTLQGTTLVSPAAAAELRLHLRLAPSASKDGAAWFDEVAVTAVLGSPPAALGLDPFYQKYLDANGIPVVASVRVSDAALLAAREIIVHMLSARADVREAMIGAGARIGVMASSEVTTDIPEHRDLYVTFPGVDWNRHRGLGGTLLRPVTTVGEENLLCEPTDVHFGESVLVREFARAVYEIGLRPLDGGRFARLVRRAYRGALEAGLLTGTDGAISDVDYWAEGVQSWFNANLAVPRPNDAGNVVDARAELRARDPALAALIGQVFADDAFLAYPCRR